MRANTFCGSVPYGRREARGKPGLHTLQCRVHTGSRGDQLIPHPRQAAAPRQFLPMARVLEEFARQMIHAEEIHAAEIDKMLRKPGEVRAFAARND